MTIAYLVNRYPAVSHTFIRREIVAHEADGLTILRYTIRQPQGSFPDTADADESGKTTGILAQGAVSLLTALAVTALTSPAALARGASLAWRMARQSGGNYVRHGAYLAEAAWLARDLKRHGITHLHAHFGTNPAAVARLTRALGGPPYSVTVHGPDEFDAPVVYDLAGKIADAKFVAAISSFGASQLMRWADWRHWDRIAVVRCGLDAGFNGSPLVPVTDTQQLCYVGRLGAQKGLPILVDAVAMIAADYPGLRIVMLGEGPLRAELEHKIAALGIANHFAFHGAASNADVRMHLQASRALVTPSFAEGLPVVIMEALALGRPVVTTAIAGIPELVDGANGWVVPAGDARAFADAMRAALEASVTTLSAMGDVGRDRVATHHDATKNAAHLRALIMGPVS